MRNVKINQCQEVDCRPKSHKNLVTKIGHAAIKFVTKRQTEYA